MCKHPGRVEAIIAAIYHRKVQTGEGANKGCATARRENLADVNVQLGEASGSVAGV